MFNDVFTEEWNHFIIFYEDNDGGTMIYHMIGYKNVPDEANIMHNVEELVDEFGYGDRARQFKIKLIDKETAQKIFNEMENGQ